MQTAGRVHRSMAGQPIVSWPARRFSRRLQRKGVEWLRLSDDEVASSKELRHARVHRGLCGGDYHRHSRRSYTRPAGARVLVEVLFNVCRPTLDDDRCAG